MPILPLEKQKRGHKIGEIRLGMVIKNSNGKSMPTSIETFRFTTKWRRVADAVADRFGGTATPATLQNGEETIEVLSTAKEIPVVVPPGEAVITQWRELWGKGYCERRCDGVTEKLSGSPCSMFCPTDEDERLAAVKAGTACKDTTRLSVMIPDLPGFGVWKVESKGYNAAVEMIDNADLLTAAREKGVYLPATLRLDSRMEKKNRNGKIETLRYVVPVLMVDHSLREIASGQVGSGIAAALPTSTGLALEAQSGNGHRSGETTALALDSHHGDDSPASAFQKNEIRRRQSALSVADKANFDKWLRTEMKAKGRRTWGDIRSGDVRDVIRKLDQLTGQRTPGAWDDDEGPAGLDDQIVDAEIVEDGGNDVA